MLLAALICSTSVLGYTPSGFDYDAWERVVKKHVGRGGLMGVPTSIVQYGPIGKDPDFQKAVDSLATAKVWDLSTNESLALGCNAYNIFAIKQVVDNPCRRGPKGECYGPNYGVRNMKTGFTGTPFNFGGANYSLDSIESQFHPHPHRPLFPDGSKEDLRAHACLICTGISCPDLLFYDPAHVQDQLNHAATMWMANPFKGMRIDVQSKTVYWSDIMNWFHDEFVLQGGIEVSYGKFLAPSARKFFADMKEQNEEYQTDYLNYVWDANGPIPCDCLPDVTDSAAWAEQPLQQGPTPFCHIAIAPKGGKNTSDAVVVAPGN